MLPEDPGFGDRFWYWRGLSGRAYIHSIYSKEGCPPLGDAVVVLVRRSGGMRWAVAIGRYGALDGPRLKDEAAMLWDQVDEIHVHLLARDPAAASAVQRDLEGALFQAGTVIEEGVSQGFAEQRQLALELA